MSLALLTRIIDLAVELLGVVGLEQDLALDQVLDSPLHQGVRLLTDLLGRGSIVNCGWLIVLHQELLLNVLGEEGFFERVRVG